MEHLDLSGFSEQELDLMEHFLSKAAGDTGPGLHELQESTSSEEGEFHTQQCSVRLKRCQRWRLVHFEEEWAVVFNNDKRLTVGEQELLKELWAREIAYESIRDEWAEHYEDAGPGQGTAVLLARAGTRSSLPRLALPGRPYILRLVLVYQLLELPPCGRAS